MDWATWGLVWEIDPLSPTGQRPLFMGVLKHFGAKRVSLTDKFCTIVPESAWKCRSSDTFAAVSHAHEREC